VAQVNYSEGVASTAPDTSAPDDYQHIQSSPADFGGLIAQGAEKLGAATSNTASFFGQVQTDDALNNAMGQANKLVENFKSLNGADALRAQADTNQQLDAAFKTARDGLGTPEQQYQFDQQARNYRERYIAGQVSAHATQQARVYTNKVTSDQADLADGHIATNAADPVEFANGAHDLRDALVKQAVNMYGGNPDDPNDPVVNDAIKRADQRATVTRIKALTPTDPMMAKQILDANKDILADTPAYDALSGQVTAQANKIAAVPIANTYLRRAGVAVTPTGPALLPVSADGSVSGTPIGPDQIAAALHDQESGGAANAPTSVTGATGGWQIQPETFDQYAKPGEKIDNPGDNAAVGQRIVADLYQKAGGDPARVAVGYFSGPGNIAPPGSPTPWIQDKQDPTGKSVSSYVQDVSARLQKSNMLVDKATGLAQIDQDFAGNPQLAAAVRSHYIEQYSIANMAQQSRALVQRDQSEQAHNYWTTQIMKGATPDIIPQIANDTRLTSTDKENLYGFSERVLTKSAGGDAAHFGSGYYDALSKINLPNGDPDRINSVSQLIARAGQDGDLNSAGVERLTGVLGSLNKPENAAFTAVQKGALTYAKNQLSFEVDNGLFKLRDVNGENAFNIGFIPAFYKAWDAGVAAGKSPNDFMNKDAIDGLVKQFKRDPAALAHDMSVASNPTLAGGPAATPFDIDAAKSADDVVAAYRNGSFGPPESQASREAAAQAIIKRGWGIAKPQVPVMH
jgi:hypothetical protein